MLLKNKEPEVSYLYFTNSGFYIKPSQGSFKGRVYKLLGGTLNPHPANHTLPFKTFYGA